MKQSVLQKVSLCSALAGFAGATSFLTLLPAQAAPLASAGSYTLTQANVDDEVAAWQIAAGHPFSPADRQAVQNAMVSVFRHDPAWLLADVRQTHTLMPRLRRMDGAQRAAMREASLVDIYCAPQKLHMTAGEAAQMQALMARYVPVVGVDAASGTVITGRDLDAAAAASRFVAAKAHLPDYSARFRSDLANIARKPASLGPVLRADLANMERNWAALQLTWPHESAAYRAQMLNRVVPSEYRTGGGWNESRLAASALTLGAQQYEDYPYALDPRLAARKRAMTLREMRFQGAMMNYNTQKMMLGGHNAARATQGQGPDLSDPRNSIMLPVP
jgi:hypothetical protein